MEFINFYNKNNGKLLAGYTADGTFEGERQATAGLLAYENNINVTDIEIRREIK